MPFVLANSPDTFQRLMDLVLSWLYWSHCLIYLDGIIVFASCIEHHLQRLDTVLGRIVSTGLTLKPSKCQWLKSSVKFLGHIVSEKGVTVDHSPWLILQKRIDPLLGQVKLNLHL